MRSLGVFHYLPMEGLGIETKHHHLFLFRLIVQSHQLQNKFEFDEGDFLSHLFARSLHYHQSHHLGSSMFLYRRQDRVPQKKLLKSWNKPDGNR